MEFVLLALWKREEVGGELVGGHRVARTLRLECRQVRMTA